MKSSACTELEEQDMKKVGQVKLPVQYRADNKGTFDRVRSDSAPLFLVVVETKLSWRTNAIWIQIDRPFSERSAAVVRFVQVDTFFRWGGGHKVRCIDKKIINFASFPKS